MHVMGYVGLVSHLVNAFHKHGAVTMSLTVTMVVMKWIVHMVLVLQDSISARAVDVYFKHLSVMVIMIAVIFQMKLTAQVDHAGLERYVSLSKTMRVLKSLGILLTFSCFW